MDELDNVDKEIKYLKEAILSSQKYLDKRDLISILLDDVTEYSLDEVEKLIEEFLNKEVN
ncbi:hypothetical protein [Leptotrichia shahii]|uniref:hypothetical protein n=1 Tax=Leptotrichia shahii TaxID=157691 RepID=UPI0028D6AEF0|nr:hypothetical protein [Leptotrichia shahii]